MSTSRALAALVSVSAAAALCACLSGNAQRLPGPLLLPTEPAALSAAPSGVPAVTVQRDSDPVWVRRPGERGDVELPFYKKRERLASGTLVRTGAGGRAELLWSPDATALVLFDEGRLTLGDVERGEPLVRFHSLTHALLTLTPEDRIELLGGARLSGDASEPTGPILLECVPGAILRVTNQSKRSAQIAFRDARLELGPGESIDVPVLASGGAPLDSSEPQRLEVFGQPVLVQGRTERSDEADGVRLTALEPTRVHGFGIEAVLEAQQSLRFSGLARISPAKTADPSPQP
ncbi:MAG: hypothetical protein EXS08_12595 [Planctomycetes bacterium]|nr:hypothetical protein [Planctomycetota bacterium]